MESYRAQGLPTRYTFNDPILESLEEVKNLIGDTKTETGLKVFVKTSKKVYKKGVKIAKELIDQINIQRHGNLGQLNYTISQWDQNVNGDAIKRRKRANQIYRDLRQM